MIRHLLLTLSISAFCVGILVGQAAADPVKIPPGHRIQIGPSEPQLGACAGDAACETRLKADRARAALALMYLGLKQKCATGNCAIRTAIVRVPRQN